MKEEKKMNNSQTTQVSLLLTGILLLLPTVARANHGLAGLDGLAYIFLGLIVVAILFIVNMSLFTSNIKKRSRGRAVAVTVLSAPMVAICLFVVIKLLTPPAAGGNNLMFFCAALAIIHIAFIIASAKTIKELSTKTKENEPI